MKHGRNLVLAGAALLAQALPLAAQRSEPSSLAALRITEPIRLDGRLDEPAWARAQHVSNFTQRELDFGRPVTERTEVAVLADQDALYVGFWGYDSAPAGIRANEMAWDFSWGADDNFEIVLDPFDDDRSGYLFVTNPNGARADALIADNGRNVNRDWDGVWDARARRTEEGWFAEIRIPFSTLRFPPQGSGRWGINFERNVRRLREQVMWQGWSRDFDLERISQAGELTGIVGVSGTKLAEARPFAIGGVEKPRGMDASTVRDAGLDVIWLPTPNWKVNFTVQPDFAQVESDREEVNLTRFSIFYPEKRTFFLEGSEVFSFDLGSDVRPFYSRRIGVAEDRTEIPIAGGVRVLGTTGGTTLGAMALRTEGHDGDPASDFAVARWKRNVLDESSVGGLAVMRHEAGRTSFTYGADLRYGTSEFMGERELAAGLNVAQTYTSDAPDRLATAHRLWVSYPNDLVEASASWTHADTAFNPEVGYVRRNGFHQISADLGVSPRPRALPFVRQLEFKLFEMSWYLNDRTGDMQSFYGEVVPLAFGLKSGESFELALSRRGDAPDEPFELFEDAVIPAGTYWFNRWALDVSSWSGRPLSGSVEVSSGDFYSGTRREVTLSGRWKTGKHLRVSGDLSHNRIVFEDESFAVKEASGRLDFALSPNLFGAVAGQWNSEDDEVILNFRLNWIPQPGSDVYLVVNQLADPGDVFWRARRTTAVTKLVWRIAF
jgi:hypothetical protein